MADFLASPALRHLDLSRNLLEEATVVDLIIHLAESKTRTRAHAVKLDLSQNALSCSKILKKLHDRGWSPQLYRKKEWHVLRPLGSQARAESFW